MESSFLGDIRGAQQPALQHSRSVSLASTSIDRAVSLSSSTDEGGHVAKDAEQSEAVISNNFRDHTNALPL